MICLQIEFSKIDVRIFVHTYVPICKMWKMIYNAKSEEIVNVLYNIYIYLFVVIHVMYCYFENCCIDMAVSYIYILLLLWLVSCPDFLKIVMSTCPYRVVFVSLTYLCLLAIKWWALFADSILWGKVATDKIALVTEPLLGCQRTWLLPFLMDVVVYETLEIWNYLTNFLWRIWMGPGWVDVAILFVL